MTDSPAVTDVIGAAVAAAMIAAASILSAAPAAAQSAGSSKPEGWQTTTAAPATSVEEPNRPDKSGNRSLSTKASAVRPKGPRQAKPSPPPKGLLPDSAQPQGDAKARDTAPTRFAAEAAAAAAAPAPAPAESPQATPAGKPSTNPEYASAVQRFCASIGPTAIEARFAWQRRTIAELEKEIAVRVGKLDAKIEEHKAWLAKRDAFAAKASANLLQVLTKMKPEAAAAQLAEMEEDIAAALLMKLEPKVAGPLLGEIPAAKAARLSGLIAAAAEIAGRGPAIPKAATAAPAPRVQAKEGGN